MNLIKLKILTPEGIFLEQEVYRIDIKTITGDIGILANHIPLVSSIDIGRLQLLDAKEKPMHYALHGGLLNVAKKETVIITNAIEPKDKIDKKRAELAKINATKALNNKGQDMNQKAYELALKRAITRLNV